VPRDRLIFYLAFDGLDAHSEAWEKTAAFKMLNSTPLGVMLEEVAAQLLEKLLNSVPNRKLTGAEVVTLVKSATHRGWVLAVSGSQDPKNPVLGTLVLRGLAAKEVRPLSSRLMGMLMGSDKPRIERKAGRVLVVLSSATSESSGVWWPEKDDLVLGLTGGSDADSIIAALDGKTPSATDHAVLAALAKPEGSFVPLMTAFVDPSAVPSEPKGKMAEFFDNLKTTAGITRIDYRWGFDDDALMSITRLVAPAPRKSALAIFDQPKLDTKQLIPIPDGVDSFLLLSLSPAKVLDALTQIGPAGQMKAKIDEAMEKIRTESRIDFEKDFLDKLGPKMALYLAPGRSAATTDETPESAFKAGALDPAAMFSALQTALPKPTLVAEIRDPAAFGKALDAVMVAVNKALKAQAIEKAATESASAESGPGAGQGGAQAGLQGPGRGRGQRGEGYGERPARKRSPRQTAAPEFRLMPGSEKTYMLVVPSDSSLKIGSPGAHPTLRVEGKYVAFSSTSEAARGAIEAIKKKGWKPSAEVDQALSHAPADLILLAVDDPRETVPALLASLPGTLQTQINTMIAMSGATAAGAAPGSPGGGPAQPGPAGAFRSGGSSSGGPGTSGGPGSGPTGGRRGGKLAGELEGGGPGTSGGQSGYPGSSSSGGPPQGYPGMSGRMGFSGSSGGQAPATAGSSAPQDAMIQLKIDPSKLPKTEELKALMFPGTVAVAVDDESIRLIFRESFPNVVNGMGTGALGGALLAPAIQAARARAAAAAAGAAGPAPAAPGTPPSAAAAPTPPPAAGAAGARPPGARGGRRGREPD
jgi:hypothetical protein